MSSTITDTATDQERAEIVTEVREYLAATLDSYCVAAAMNDPDQTEAMVAVAEHFRSLINCDDDITRGGQDDE